MSDTKIREDRCRRSLRARGLRLKKTPARSWLRAHYGPGYMVVDVLRNTVVAGYSGREYALTLEETEALVFGEGS